MRLWFLAAWACALAPAVAGMTASKRAALRDEVRDMFHHAFTGYMTYAYPADELRPLTCSPRWRDPDTSNVGVNDVSANISMTLVDSLSAIALILPEEYPAAVERVAKTVTFDQDVKVQVFELTIRAMGALLSTYQKLNDLPDDPRQQAKSLGIAGSTDVKKYAPRMLELALDLGKRLLPAFETPTGLPYARVNLRYGVERRESYETCTAGAGSLVLEFTLLSRLTGDPRFEDVAHRAFMALWNRRTDMDLVGNGISINHGQWLQPGLSGVNAGIDSFFEYALKAAIMFDEPTYMDVFHDGYAAIQTHVRTADGFIYRPIGIKTMQPSTTSVIDSLSSFFPGVMVLAGDIESAIRGHLVFWNLWRKYSAIPESWGHAERKVGWGGWPGRPEFIESTYYLHRATGDDFYLRVGERVLHDIRRRTITSCGFASLSNVETGETEDRMESFLLSETFKYLYLLFDDPPSEPPSNTVFTTEGHPLYMPRDLIKPPSSVRRSFHRREDLYCPVYTPQMLGPLVVGIEGRDDYEYARTLVFGPGEEGLKIEDWRPSVSGSFCAVPEAPRYAFDLLLRPADDNPDAPPPKPDLVPSAQKVFQNALGDWVIADIDGLQLQCRWRLDGAGYDVTRIGPHRVRHGQRVFITDPKMDGYLPSLAPERDFPGSTDVTVIARQEGSDDIIFVFEATTALFGASFVHSGTHVPRTAGGVALDAPLVLAVDLESTSGCNVNATRLDPDPDTQPFALLVSRGECTFADKAMSALRAGASMVLIANNESTSEHVRPAADQETEKRLAELADIRVALLARGDSVILSALQGSDPPLTVSIGPRADKRAMPEPERREGRLAVGHHELINIRVVDENVDPHTLD